jgi:hypothetical protein
MGIKEQMDEMMKERTDDEGAVVKLFTALLDRWAWHRMYREAAMQAEGLDSSERVRHARTLADGCLGESDSGPTVTGGPMPSNEPRIGSESYTVDGVKVRISTVHLDVPHPDNSANDKPGRPMHYETMIWADGEEVFCERYETLTAARNGHARTVGRVVTEPAYLRDLVH